MSDFRLEVVPASPRTDVVRVHGHLDARSATTLLSQCRMVAQEGKHLVLNLAGVAFISSSGIGALLALVEEHNQTPYQVRLTEVSPAADSVIRLLNLDQILAIDATEEASRQAVEAA
ncbi:MAG TPA: STAS domain-containing protein [Candidatus Limnocylindria bacterium]|nr:STAS domain-containing protein [Candidatus Limnocylindria bacterium]